MNVLKSNLDKIIASLNLNLQEDANRYFGSCPVHSGDKTNAFHIYKNSGIWKCFTHNCHEEYTVGIIGLVEAIFQTDKKEAIKYIVKTTGEKLNKPRYNKVEHKISVSNNIFKEKQIASRDDIRKLLTIPAEYYIRRNFSPKILDKYDIGLCNTPGKPMYRRVVIPIYNAEYSAVIACSGRATYNTDNRWIHSAGFNRNQNLYNVWFAAKYIRESKTVILSEGPAKIWRLEESDIHNGLAIYGTEFTINQQKILSKLGVLNIILALDNDPAGQKSMFNIYSKLKNLYNITIPKDLPEDLDKCLSSQIHKIFN